MSNPVYIYVDLHILQYFSLFFCIAWSLYKSRVSIIFFLNHFKPIFEYSYIPSNHPRGWDGLGGTKYKINKFSLIRDFKTNQLCACSRMVETLFTRNSTTSCHHNTMFNVRRIFYSTRVIIVYLVVHTPYPVRCAQNIRNVAFIKNVIYSDTLTLEGFSTDILWC